MNERVIHYSNYLKEQKKFSIDDSATRPNFEGHLLSFDKDTKFPNVVPIFKKGSRFLTAQVLTQ